MESQSSVSHDGVVESVAGESVFVRFIAQSACSACHAKGVCSISNSEEKVVEVKGVKPGWKPGDHVTVLLEQRQGFIALMFGYGIPLVVLLAVLFTVSAITGREAFSALIALGSLLPYYLIIWLFRKRISGKFEFRIRRTE
jgi:sigma-E factor negative regulatory protein RseC